MGIITGKTSKLAVLDIDDLQQFEQWLEDNGYTLPDTPTVKTPNRGFHYYFRIPEGVEVRSKVIVKGVLELKGQGTLVAAPPSSITKTVIDNGIKEKYSLPYEWLGSPEDVDVAEHLNGYSISLRAVLKGLQQHP